MKRSAVTPLFPVAPSSPGRVVAELTAVLPRAQLGSVRDLKQTAQRFENCMGEPWSLQSALRFHDR